MSKVEGWKGKENAFGKLRCQRRKNQSMMDVSKKAETHQINQDLYVTVDKLVSMLVFPT